MLAIHYREKSIMGTIIIHGPTLINLLINSYKIRIYVYYSMIRLESLLHGPTQDTRLFQQAFLDLMALPWPAMAEFLSGSHLTHSAGFCPLCGI